MTEKKENIWIPKLKEQLAERQIDRREFVRYTTLLGMSAGVAYGWAGKITGEAFAPAARAMDIPKGGILKISQRIPKLDNPHTFSWVYDSNCTRQVVDYLTETGSDNVTRPSLFESWEVSDDLKTWTFKCRDVKWRKGDQFTAEHAAWNLKRVLDAATGSSVLGLMKGYMLKEVDSGEKDDKGNAKMTTELWDANAIEVVDDKTVRLNLANAQVAVPEHLFHYPLSVLHPAENGTFGIGSDGTGAFEMVELEVGQKCVMKARTDGGYWREGPYLDEIHFLDLGDNPVAEAAAFRSKQVHLQYEGNNEQLALFKGMDHVEIYNKTTAQTGVARLRLDQPQFQDKRVRQAFRYATDSAKTLEIAHDGLGSEGEHHHVSPVHPDYFKLEPMGRDVAKAKALLAEAGFADGIEVEIACKKDPTWEIKAVEAMAQQWAEAGIKCKINVLPSSKFWEVWDKVPFGFTSWTHRPLGFMVLSLAYRSGVPWNESAYANPEFDSILTKAEGTLDVKARSELIGQLEKIMQDDGPIVQPLWRAVFSAADKRVKGFDKHPTNYFFAHRYGVEA